MSTNKIYIFDKEGNLLHEYPSIEETPEKFNRNFKGDIYISWFGFFSSDSRKWTNKYWEQLDNANVPKELKLALLLLGEIP